MNKPTYPLQTTTRILHNLLILIIFNLLLIPHLFAQDVELIKTYQSGSVKINTIEDLAFDQSDNLAAVDAKSGLLIKLNTDGSHSQIPLSGGGIFKSTKLSGVCVIKDGYIISNSTDGKIAHINSKGELQTLYGEKGSKAGMLSSPRSVKYSLNDRLYVADTGNSNISIYNRTGVYLSSVGNTGADQNTRLKKPSQVEIDAMERIYVLETGSSAVLSVYKSSGELLKQRSSESIKPLLGGKIDLSALGVDPAGRVFLGDSVTGKIIHYDWEKNKVLFSFGSKGNGPGQYQSIAALSVSKSNKIAVADTKNKKIDLYQLSGLPEKSYERAWLPNIGRSEFISMSCTSGFRINDSSILCLNSKTDVASLYGTDGKLLKTLSAKFKDPLQASYSENEIAILNKSSVSVLTLDGNFISQFGKSGSKDGQLGSPSDIYIRNNKIYVAESSNKRIQIFSMKGVHLGKVPVKNSAQFLKPVSVAVDTNNNMYVADDKKKKVLVFSKDKKFLYEIGESPEAPGGFKNIFDLELDSDNNLYILASTGINAQTVQVFSGPNLIFEFGSSSKKSASAIVNGTSISISPTEKTLVSIFDNNSKRAGLLSYNYLQIPAKIGGVVVSGGAASTKIKWQRPPGNYISGYRLYGSKTGGDDYEFIKDTKQVQETLSFDEGKGYKYYRVSGISGFGIEGPRSNPREDVFQKAYGLYQNGDYQQSVDILLKDLADNSEQAEAIKYLGLSYLGLKKYTLAQEQFKILSGFENRKVEGLNLQIEALFENGDYTDAIVLVEDVIKASNNNIDSYIFCGKLSLKMGDPIRAVECLEDAKSIDDKNAQIYVLLGESYIKAGAEQNGILELEKAVGLEANNIVIQIQCGDQYAALGKHDIAKQKYEKALEIDPDNTHAQLGLAKSFLETKNLIGAKNIAIKLAGKKETGETGHYLLGLIAMQNNSYGEAVISLGRATRVNANNAQAWLAQSDAYEQLKQKDKQLTSLENAAKAEPPVFAALKRFGLMLYQEGNFAKAADILSRASELNPGDYQAHYYAAAAYFEDQKYTSSLSYGRKAIELNKEAVEPLVLLAKISHKRGKTGAAIEYAKNAVALKADGADIHILLGELYLDNNLYDDAKVSLEKAAVVNKTLDRPHVLLGTLYSNRRLFDKAIKEFEIAVKLNGSAENRLALDTAYADKKKSLDFSQNAPQLVLEDLNLGNVFSAAYKQYNDKPVGAIKVRNVGATDYGNLKVSFEIKGYMDFPTSHTIAKLSGNSVEEVPLKAAFNNKVLEIDEDTGVQVEVKLTYVREGRNDDISVTRPMTIYGKNAIIWNTPEMVGSFVTPKDDTLRDFVRQTVNSFKPDRGPLSENLVTAMTVFDAMSAYGLKYSIDPNNPFSDLKMGQIDYVQFARETLKLKSGDCDDLSVLLSASLENLGIETALLDVPGHLLMMFNTTVPESEQTLISGQDDLLVVHDGTVWIPIEATMIATNFTEAWAEGARKYHENKKNDALKEIFMKDAWKSYQPVTLAKANYELGMPDEERAKPLIEREQKLLLEKGLARLVLPYQAMIQNNPKDTVSRMQIAIIYARYGLHDKAIVELDKLLEFNSGDSAVYNNRGNIYLARGDFQRAQEAYSHAEKLDANDAGIKLNLSMALYKDGKLSNAKNKYSEAAKLDQSLIKEYDAFGKLLNN